jgi:CheY-specific phosphatase CheX
MIPSEDQVRSVVRNVWSTQLGLQIDDLGPDVDAPAKPAMTAAIHITGDFRGWIRLECSAALVRRAAAIMFQQPEDDLRREDDLDVIGEITNVVAGNIKALIDGHNSLSLPTIIEGSDYEVETIDVKSADRYAFGLGGEVLVATVVEHLG